VDFVLFTVIGWNVAIYVLINSKQKYSRHTNINNIYPRRGSRGISDIPPRPRLTKMAQLWGVLQTGQVVSSSPSDRSLSSVSAINRLVVFYDNRIKREVFFYSVPDSTIFYTYNNKSIPLWQLKFFHKSNFSFSVLTIIIRIIWM
jgi:hypothetical protein